MPRLRDRAERRLRVGRIAHYVGADERLGRGDEALVDRLVHVDALDGAAALPRVVDRAVDDVLDRLLEVAVRSRIGGIVSAELEADVEEAVLRGGLDAMASMDGAREEDVVDTGIPDEPFGVPVVDEDRGNGALRRARLDECAREVLSAQRRSG